MAIRSGSGRGHGPAHNAARIAGRRLHLAAIRLAPGERTPKTSISSQALVAAASQFALDSPGVDLDDELSGSLAVGLVGLEPIASLAAEVGTAAELGSAEPSLVNVTLRRRPGHLPVVDVTASQWFDPGAWNASMTKRRSYRRKDDITSRFHDHLLKLFRGDPSMYEVVDDLLFQVHGFRLIDVFVVLDECARQQAGTATEPRAVLTDSLIDALAADGHQARRRAAIEALSWPARSDDTWRPWSMIEDPRRLSVRPLLPVRAAEGDAVVFAPTVARAANDVWNDRLAEGNWPLRSFDRGQEGGLRRPYAQLAGDIDRFFELQVANELIRAGSTLMTSPRTQGVNATFTAGHPLRWQKARSTSLRSSGRRARCSSSRRSIQT